MEKHVYQEIPAESIKISAVFQDNSMNLTVFENDSAWCTLITRMELKMLAESHKVEYTEYIQNLRKFLEQCPQDVEIKFREATLCVNILLKNNMKAVYFTTILRKVNFSNTVFDLVSKFYKENSEHSQIIEEKQRQYENIEKSKNYYETKLNEFIQRKHAEESALFSKFVVILNEKKHHIQHLNDLLNAFRRGRPTVNEPVIKKARRKKNDNTDIKTVGNVAKEEKIESDSDISEQATSSDEEQNKPNIFTSKNVNEQLDSPIPSTSKDVIIMNSLLEDEGDNFFHDQKKIKCDTNKVKCQNMRHDSQKDEKSQEVSSPGIDLDTQDFLNDIL